MEEGGWPKDGEIEQSIVNRGAWCDEAIVAVLIGVGDGDNEAAGLDLSVRSLDRVDLGLVPKDHAHGGGDVGSQAPAFQLVEARAEIGVESQAHDIEEGLAIGGAGIDGADFTVQQSPECTLARPGNAEVAAETIPGAAGNQTERCGRAHERGGDFVQGAVAADGHDPFAPFIHGLTSQLRGVTRPFRGNDHGIKPVFSDERARFLQEVGIAGVVPGAGIEDKPRFQSGERRWTWEGEHGNFATLRAIVGALQRFAGGYGGNSPSRNRTNTFYSGDPSGGMESGMTRRIHVLTGPTAVGKTALALRWAETHRAEIVSCDSLLFYRGMDIGTAKPSPEERARVPHHLIDILDVREQADVTHFVTLARAAVEAITARGGNVLVTGGSGFYLKAFFGPVADNVHVPDILRTRLRAQHEAEGLPALIAELRRLNPDGLGELDTANPRRVLRGLERCLASGRTLVELAADFARQPAPFDGWAVTCTRLDRLVADLDVRIERRVVAMLKAGLVAEVERLLVQGLRENPSAASAIGYRETVAMLEGRLSREALPSEIARNTRALVKKQRTWFRTQLPEHRVVDADAAEVASLF